MDREGQWRQEIVKKSPTSRKSKLSKAKRQLEKIELELLKYINRNPKVLSVLYDLNLMPEQLKHGSYDWGRMMILASWYRNNQQ